MSEHEQPQTNQTGDVINIDQEVFEALEATRIQAGESRFDRRLGLTAGETHQYYTPDGVLEYVTFDALNITGLNARTQEVRSGKALSIAINMVLHGFETGTVDDNGDFHKHEFLGNPRYEAFRDPNRFPPRIAGSAWVIEENIPLFVEMVNGLLKTGNFTALKNPKNHPDSERTTRDRVRLIPHGASADRLGDPDYGYSINGIEMQVNTEYERGHISFTNGLDEQVARIESVMSIEQSDVQRNAMVELLRNVNYVSGVSTDDQSRERPRQLDIGKLFFGDKEFALYTPGGTIISAGLFDDVVTSGKSISDSDAAGSVPTPEELSEADLNF